jgi:catechol 2,3-dioxygenase-like lactoylglutathione lyase family enzyme
MPRNPDHVTIVVSDVEEAKEFFALLGFEEEMTKVIGGEVMAAYMGVPGIEAEHITLVLKGCTPHFDIQLLKFHNPRALPDPHIRDLYKVGFNHLSFAVDDIKSEVQRLKDAGVKFRNDIMDFRGLRLVFLEGPEGITLELVERGDQPGKDECAVA